MTVLPTARAPDPVVAASGVTSPDVGSDLDRLTDLQTSARGWHGAQLAVLGFIGLCGALQGGGSDQPGWLQRLAGLLVLAALALACVATVLVAITAWPVYGGRAGATDPGEELARGGRRLRAGLVLTFVAVAVLALATSSGWWPTEASSPSSADASSLSGGSLVEVTTSKGTACGTLVSGDAGRLALDVSGQRFALELSDLRAVRPVVGC